VANWIEPLAATLAAAAAFRGHALRPARRDDEELLFALHRSAMREYVEATWGWDERWQRANFARTYKPAWNAVVVRTGAPAVDVGRISLARRWRKIFLRDIELVAAERNHGLGGAMIAAVLAIARAERREVELLVLRCNPAQRLYARLGFEIAADDGERLTMRGGRTEA
jgi:GNAT superfamily N-acetyltransferase